MEKLKTWCSSLKKSKTLLLVLLCVVVCGCAVFLGFGQKIVYDGSYKFISLTYDDGDNTFTAKRGDKFEGMELEADTFILVIRGDTFALRIKEADEDEVYEYVYIGKWMKGYKKEMYLIALADIEEPVIATKKSNKITIEYERIKITFKR